MIFPQTGEMLQEGKQGQLYVYVYIYIYNIYIYIYICILYIYIYDFLPQNQRTCSEPTT